MTKSVTRHPWEQGLWHQVFVYTSWSELAKSLELPLTPDWWLKMACALDVTGLSRSGVVGRGLGGVRPPVELTFSSGDGCTACQVQSK